MSNGDGGPSERRRPEQYPVSGRERAAFRVIQRRLRDAYGQHHWRRDRVRGSALDELIGTVLSQNTSDVNTARSFRSLRARFPTWEDVRTAPTDQVIDAIRSGGLARIKAPRIQDILDQVLDKEGSLSLDRLADVPSDQANAELTALSGVGPKTAACVLMFNLGRPVMPVDTHVHRVSQRLGLVNEGASERATQARLEQLCGAATDDVLTLHLNLIHHGRTTCTSRTPHCERCPLTGHCRYYQQLENRQPHADRRKKG